MKLTSILSIIFLFIYSSINAQQKSITGTVKSGDEPLAYVTIIIKGTSKGTSTNEDGNFNIDVLPTDILVFNYIGYVSQEIAVEGKTTIDVNLKENVTQLTDIVLVGYGKSNKKDVTGAVSSVKGKELEKRNVTNIQEALQGQLPGVQVSSGGGRPGSEASITVRGFSTVNNNAPLYVVDDVPLDDISFLTPNDIESIQVLKDASASAIFGSRASNGVIIIETKKGKEGKTTINIDAFTSIQTVAKKPNLANGTEYAQTINAARINDGNTPLYEDPSAFGEGTDWWDLFAQDAIFNNVALDIRNGTERLKLSSGLTFQDQDGIQRGSDFRRITARLNTEYKLRDKLTFTQNFSIATSLTTNGPELFWDSQRLEPITQPFLPSWEQSSALNEFSIFSPTITDVPNAAGRLARNFNTTNYLRGLISLGLNWEVINGLTFITQYSNYFSSFENNNFSPNYYIEPNDQLLINNVSRTHNNRTENIWNNTLSYTRKIDNHSFTVLGGLVMESREHRTLFGRGQNIPSNAESLQFLNAATDFNAFFASGNNENYNLLSYVSRLNYSFNNKYIFNASVRVDGSSLFPKENQWGVFPSVSGAWIVSEESFMKKTNSLINFLKLRVGWGQIGNDNRFSLPANARITTIANDFYTIGSGQSLYIAAVPGNVGNPNIKWETVEDFNLGMDLNLFESKLGINLDVYQRNTYDMIMPQSLPSYLGSGFDRQWANVGNFQNKGFDLGLNYKTNIGQVKSTFGLNISHYKAVVKKLAAGEIILAGNHDRLGNIGRTVEGQTPGLFFGYVTDGIFQNQTEINSHSDQFGNIIQPNARPGDFRFVDINGDGQLTQDDRKIIGDPTPDFTFGIPMSFTYKGFDLNTLLTGSYGNDMINAARPYLSNGGELYNSYAGVLANSWNGEGSTNSNPRVSIDDPNQNFRYSDFYIEDGSYIRLQNIQIGYSLGEKLTQKYKLTKLRIYLSAENLITLSSFSGLEVDVPGSATLRGVEWGNYPVPRTFTFGFNLGL